MINSWRLKLNKLLTGSISVLLLVFTISCVRENDVPDFVPPISIDPQKINTTIKLSDSVVENSYKNDEILRVTVTNHSDDPVIFTNDFGIKIFTVQGNSWVEIQNNYSYDENPGRLPPYEDVPIGFVIKMLPSLPEMHSSQSIRVLVVGYPESNKNQPVGAFMDILLYP